MSYGRHEDAPGLCFRRLRAGYYRAKSITEVVMPWGKSEKVPVTVDVRYIPEWSGSDKWAVTVEGRYMDSRLDLVSLTDIVAPTKAEAVRQAEMCVAEGFQHYPGIGYSARVK